MPILNSLSVLGSHFSSAPTGNWYDDSSNAHRAVTLNGSVTQSDEGGGVKVAQFDGTPGYLSSPNSIDFDLDGDFTVESFIKGNNTGSNFIINGSGAASNGATLAWGIRSDAGETGSLSIFRYDGSSESWFNFNNSGILNGSWHHIAASRTSGVLNLYVDGVLTNTYNTDLQLNRINSTDPLQLGHAQYGSGTDYYTNGSLAAVRVIKGTGIYSGSSFTVPAVLPTDIAGTKLLLNFGATAVPAV